METVPGSDAAPVVVDAPCGHATPVTDGSATPTISQQVSRHRGVPVETVPDEKASQIQSVPIATPASDNTPHVHRSLAAEDVRMRDEAELEAGPSQPARRRRRAPRRFWRRGLRKWKGLFVEDFPDVLAGAPIS
ncbi:hypothetical protein FS749_015731 [Ceratobasidium sp. UAMH 11750]|nr:hypothetical protein FS749_015731 [Ceratobasidium sp. UAMH 11750]